MNATNKTGRIVGALFLFIMITWGVGFALIDPMMRSSDYLSEIYPDRMKIMIGVFFELLEVGAVLMLAFILYPLLKQRDERLAISYMGFRIFESMMLLAGIISALSLITVSQDFIESGASSGMDHQTLGLILRELRLNWSIHVLTFFHPLGAIPMYYFLYKAELVPKWISAWGLFAAILLFLDQMVLETFGLGLLKISDLDITGVNMGLNEIVIGLWLIIKGFKPAPRITGFMSQESKA